jgi:biopolymer transport protein TolR
VGVSLGSGNGRRRYMGDINVTPLVDVVLVLLIIFMVTAPMMTKGLDVRLPETTAKPLPQEEQPLTVTINAAKEIYLNKVRVDEEVLRRRLAEERQRHSDRQVLLRADRDVPYGLVAGVVASVREAGIEKLGLVTEPLSTPANKENGNKVKKGDKGIGTRS